jgi:hypothetical protein
MKAIFQNKEIPIYMGDVVQDEDARGMYIIVSHNKEMKTCILTNIYTGTNITLTEDNIRDMELLEAR